MIDTRRPSVSVIIIFLNAERFLEEAIASVLAQSYPDWELLLCDDGSTDGSTAIARRLAAEQTERVRYLEHPGHRNRGMSATRNLGIGQARGDYLAFLDADDAWFPDTLLEQVRILDERPDVAMVYGPIEWWYSWTGNVADIERDYIEELGVPRNSVINPPTLIRKFLRNRAAVPSGILIRRSVVVRLGGFENQFRGEYEDQVFCTKVCLEERVFAAGACWYRYRQHPESTVAIGIATGQTQIARRAFLDWLTRYLTSEGVVDRALWRAVQLEYLRCHHPRVFRLIRRSQRLERRLKSRFAVGATSQLEGLH